MAPKKVEEPEKKPLIGRVGTNLRVGIVGVPNVGKSTFFNVLTKSAAPAENFPFCTIDPNENKSKLVGQFFSKFHLMFEVENKCVLKGIMGSVAADFIPISENCTDFFERFVYKHSENETSYKAENSEVSTSIISTSPFVERFNEHDALELVDSIDDNKFKCLNKNSLKETYCYDKIIEEYFQMEPPRLILLGKPDIIHYEIAEKLTEKYNCCNIDANGLIKAEIANKSDLGYWLKENLELNKKIPTCLLLYLLTQELHRGEVKERGYILSGFPVVPACQFTEDILPCSWKESSTVKSVLINATEEFYVPKEEEAITPKKIPDHPHEAQTRSIKSDSYNDNTFDIKEYLSDENIMQPINEDSIASSLETQMKLLLNIQEAPYIVIYVRNDDDTVINRRKGLDPDMKSSKIENEDQIKMHLQRYAQHFKYIQKYILHFHKESVIEVNGQEMLSTILNSIHAILDRLNIKKMYRAEEIFPNGLESLLPDVCNLFAGKKLSTCLEVLREKDMIDTNIKWLESDFGTRCPVRMHEGKCTLGNPQFAVRYMGNIFLLSSENAMKKFIQSPNEYFFCKPTCRIAIMNSKLVQSDGTIANILQCLFDAEVFSFCENYEKELRAVQESKNNEIREWAKTQAVARSRSLFEEQEKGRQKKLIEWKQQLLIHLQTAMEMLHENKEIPEATVSFLTENNIDHENLENLKFILDHDSEQTKYVPTDLLLTMEVKKQDAMRGPDLAEELFRERADELSEISVTQSVLYKKIIEWIKQQDKKIKQDINNSKTYGKWVLDGLPLNLEILEYLNLHDCLPDIVLILSNDADEVLNCKISVSSEDVKEIFENICELYPKWFPKTNLQRFVDKFPKEIKQISEIADDFQKFFERPSKEEESSAEEEEDDYDEMDTVDDIDEFLSTRNVVLIEQNVAENAHQHQVFKAISRILSSFIPQPRKVAVNENATGHFMPHVDDITLKSFVSRRNSDLVPTLSALSTFEHVHDTSNQACCFTFGGTREFCPVMYTENNLLMRDEENFCIEYRNRIFMMSSEKAQEQFLEQPEKYAHLLKPAIVPPIRMCVISSCHVVGSPFAQTLSAKMKLKYISYPQLIDDFGYGPHMSSNDLGTSIEKEHFLFEKLFNYIRESFSGDVIFDGFPATRDQFDEMIDQKLYPEIVLVTTGSENLICDETYAYYKRLLLTTKDVWHKVDSESVLSFRTEEAVVLTEIQEHCKARLERNNLEIDKIIQKCIALHIPVFEIPFHTKNINKICEKFMKSFSKIVRTDLFDQVQILPFETAQKLIESGLCLLSKFGTSCPVDSYDFVPFNVQNDFRCCMYNQRIYFVNGEKNVELFLLNPKKYTNAERKLNFPKPLKLAVFGVKYSGVAMLCKRIADDYGLEIIHSKGIDGPSFENLITSLQDCKNFQSKNGFVLDNVALDPEQLVELARNQLEPHLIMLLLPKFASIWRNWQLNYFNQERPPKVDMNSHFFKVLEEYRMQLKRLKNIKKSDKTAFFNIEIITDTRSKWFVWNTTKKLIASTLRNINNYHSAANKQESLSISYINIFQQEFDHRLSIAKLFCPVCLQDEQKMTKFSYDYITTGEHFFSAECQLELNRPNGHATKNIYKRFDFPPPHAAFFNKEKLISGNSFKGNLVQIKECFYWACDSHFMELVLNSLQYVPLNNANVPSYIPFLIKYYPKWIIANEGYCQVTYCENLPDKVYTPGESDLAVYYRGKLRRVPVPDDRFTYLCEYHKPVSKVPAFLNVVDIAGLVKGAAEGQGLGNAFLSHISACDAIFHLCRAFEDTDVTHVEGEVDPVRDLDIISEELRLKDEEKLMQNLEKLERTVLRGGDKKLKPEYDTLVKIKGVIVDEKKHIRFADWSAHDIEILNKYLFLTSKPVIYLINLSEKDFIKKKNKWLIKIKEWVDKNDPGASIIPFSGAFEARLGEMDDTEKKAYEEEHKCKSMLDKIIVTGYKALQLEYFFTAGPDEVKAWTIQKGTKAPQAAGRIHTDFEKGFIMAEVMHFKDFKEEGTEAAARSAGKYRQQGRNYVVEDGDIIFFKFNAGAGLKDGKKK